MNWFRHFCPQTENLYFAKIEFLIHKSEQLRSSNMACPAYYVALKVMLVLQESF